MLEKRSLSVDRALHILTLVECVYVLCVWQLESNRKISKLKNVFSKSP